ncbi:hypothetical protein GIB67_022808 [Kingdonia uniflora]|uniref:Uncharacterized protein n=1 Tax=Kingdonia uniflora TaxID=39325 RepID=A0A7J7P6Q6_9MAGN|nr:hypothetical protein GIB67_022808 [Kingdonia uniflora]
MSNNRSSEDEEDDAEELQVKKMAELILNYRTTIPDRFRDTLSSLLKAQRPILSSPSPGDRNPDVRDNDLSKMALIAEEDPETAKKICLLKAKISANMSAMPIILKRLNDTILRIDKLGADNERLHPAFKRKKTY